MYQSSSLDFKLVQRVCLLQQALDQALDSLEEMKSQVQDKHWLEAQLANTEKYANVQQQAIAHLKQQLSQSTEIQHHLLSVVVYRLNKLIDHQQVEFNRLQLQIQQGDTELQTYLRYLHSCCHSGRTAEISLEAHRLDLEAEVMIARAMAVTLSHQLSSAKQHLDNLTSVLNNHHLNLSQIIQTVQAMLVEIASFNEIVDTQPQSVYATQIETIDQSIDEQPKKDVDILEATLHRKELRIQELEAALVEKFEQQTMLKHRFQVLAAERDHYKRQLESLQREYYLAVKGPAR